MPTGPDSHRPRAARALRAAPFVAAPAVCASPIVPESAAPPLALALGTLLALTLDNPLRRHGRLVSRYLLQACVVLLGFKMDLGTVLRAGARGVVMAAATIAATLMLGHALGRLLRIESKTSSLISSGTAICGGSAIAAVASVIGAAEGQVAVAIGAVFILNALALYIFPPIGHALGLTQEQFGVWAGVAIHDISSVVGAAKRYGERASEVAIAVKLSRTLWIIPLALLFALLTRRAGASAARRAQTPESFTPASRPDPSARPKFQIPWFIALFLLASFSRTFSPAVTQAAPLLSSIAVRGLAVTLFLIGAGISLATLRAVGPRALLQAVALWLFICSVSLLAVRVVEHPA